MRDQRANRRVGIRGNRHRQLLRRGGGQIQSIRAHALLCHKGDAPRRKSGWLGGRLGHLQNAKILAKIAEMIERMPELRTLSPSDKLALVTELWDDLASNPEDIPITPEQIAEVDKRLEEYRKNPDLGSPWEEVKARILGRNR
jgi:putative addiction module component (TIGR02574 family)